MTRLEIILIVTGVVFFFFSLDLYQRKKLNFLHFLVFWWWTWLVIYFAFFPGAIDTFWAFFWVARGADLLVYISIIVLAYLYVELINKQAKQDIQITRVIREDALSIMWSKQLEPWNDFLILLRVYNEQETIWSTIDKLIAAWYGDIVICNDGSTDQSADIIQSKQQQYLDAQIIVLKHKINRWWWAANQTLFELIKRNGKKYTWCVTFDADNQMDIVDMKVFRRFIQTESECRVFLWSRFVSGAMTSNMPWVRRYILLASQWFTYVWEGQYFTDPHNGYRVIHTSLFQDIHMSADGMAYASELLSEISRNWREYIEVPVHISYSEYSLAKWQKDSNALSIFLKLVWKRWFYK